MDKVDVICKICIEKRDGETVEEATGRLESLLDSELCNLADHHISCQIEAAFGSDCCEEDSE